MATRDRLIDAGLELFHRHGIHPVGLDRILQRAGVTKTTFYNHFESKENFACAVIVRFGEEVHSSIQRRLSATQGADTKQQLLQIFNAWDELFDNPTFRGCMLVAASVASGDQHDPARQTAIKNKRMLLEAYADLAARASIADPRQFAMRFGILVDGALIAKHLYGDGSQEAKVALEMAAELLESVLPDQAT